jgi:hypothetical protein
MHGIHRVLLTRCTIKSSLLIREIESAHDEYAECASAHSVNSVHFESVSLHPSNIATLHRMLLKLLGVVVKISPPQAPRHGASHLR